VPDDLFDTQVAASFLGMSSIGLQPLVRKLLDEELTKGDRLTDWLTRPLSAGALAYAESDVVHLFDLHDRLRAGLEERNRVAWVTSECRSMVERSLIDNHPDEAWWRVKEARRLRGRAAAIAQSVGRWREEHAMQSDRPLRSVLPDLALAGIAQRPPESVDALTKVRGLRDRGLPKAVRPELMAAIERGEALDLDEVRLPESSPVPVDVRGAVPLLMSWVAQRARELELDPAVLATRKDLESYLRGDVDSRLRHGWRAEALAHDIDALLDGQAALSFAKGNGLVLRRDPTS
jgi:ribonuclease D